MDANGNFAPIYYVGRGFPQWYDASGGALVDYTFGASPEFRQVLSNGDGTADFPSGYNGLTAGSSKFLAAFGSDTACTPGLTQPNCFTPRGCMLDCEALYPGGLDDDLQGFVVFDPAAIDSLPFPNGDEQCFCIVRADSPISGLDYNGGFIGLFVYGYGNMDNNVNGGELSPSSQPSSIPSSQPSSIPSSQPSSIHVPIFGTLIALATEIDAEFSAVHNKFDGINDTINTLATEIETEFSMVKNKFDGINSTIDTLATEIDAEFSAVHNKIDTLNTTVTARFEDIEGKVAELNATVVTHLDQVKHM